MQHLGRGTVAAVTSEAATTVNTLPRVGWDLLCHRAQDLPHGGRSAGTTLRWKVKGAVLETVVSRVCPHTMGSTRVLLGMSWLNPVLEPHGSLLGHSWGQTLASPGTPQSLLWNTQWSKALAGKISFCNKSCIIFFACLL